MTTEMTDVLDDRTTVAACCARLGLPAPLAPGQRVRWWGWDEAMATGINAALDRFDPDRDGEPYVLSIGVYERVPGLGGAGGSGAENRCVAALDLAWAAPPSAAENADPARRPLRVAAAEVAPDLAERSLDEVLRELGRLLAGWPATQETREE